MTLTGANSFNLQAKLKRIITDFTDSFDLLGLERLDGQEASLEKINEALTSLPFLAAKKLIVLREPGANKQFAEKAEQLLGSTAETTDVIIVEPKLDKRQGYYKFLKKNTDFQEFNELDSYGLGQWLIQYSKAHGGSLDSADARYLIDRVGPNQQLLSNEIDKLLLYNPKISRQSIDVLTEPNPQSTIFQLLEAAFAGQPDRAIKLYSEQRALKVEPIQIIAMITWQLHVLAIIKTAGHKTANDIAKEAKINPFVVQKSQSIASKLSLAEVKSLIADLLTIDIASKSTNIDTDDALKLYLIKLSK